jgi:hypothetical protein
MDSRTQDFVPVQEVQNGMVVSKNGSVAMIIQTSAVNFDLLSENEQMAIIGSFAGMLNSLSFSIQIVIRSKKLDISSYLEKLVKAESEQTSPLLKKLMQNYRSFVSSVIRENEVLDKQFYVVISITSLEVGMINSTSNKELFLQKALTTLTPRRDHIMRQLGRIGLKASQLDDEKLVKLFYDWYNEPVFDTMDKQEKDDIEADAKSQKEAEDIMISAQNQVSNPVPSQQAPVQPISTQPVLPPQPAPIQKAPPFTPSPVPVAQQFAPARPVQNPYPNVYPAQQINLPQVGQGQRPNNSPFVVEELHDDYGTA